jgi:hypothetical protein
LPLSERRKTLEALLARRPDALRLSPLLEAPTGQVLEAVRKPSGLRASRASSVLRRSDNGKHTNNSPLLKCVKSNQNPL